jgi:hypothetical protein
LAKGNVGIVYKDLKCFFWINEAKYKYTFEKMSIVDGEKESESRTDARLSMKDVLLNINDVRVDIQDKRIHVCEGIAIRGPWKGQKCGRIISQSHSHHTFQVSTYCTRCRGKWHWSYQGPIRKGDPIFD